MHSANQARLVGMVADGRQLDIELVGLENNGRAPDRDLSDTAGPKAAAYDDALGVPPSLQGEKPLDDGGKLLRELGDRLCV